MKTDANARYLESHEYARKEGDLVVIGISDTAQDSLGDIVYVDLPAPGTSFAKGAVFGVVESVKAASDLYLPMGGEVVEVNAVLRDDPGLINRDCHGAGWIIKIKPAAPAEWDSLMDAAAYAAMAAKE